MTGAEVPEPPEVFVSASRFTVTCIPADSAPDAHVWALHVEQKRDGKWVVTDGFGYLNGDLTFEDRPYLQCLFDLDAALALAKEAAPLMIINGRTVPQALALAAKWKEDHA
ncbi:hypothetical protein [Streptacidiphilus carbonis]|uniref:hypothetical protein n=1 Tax=Streptacidiphilus carbonis TaxID=105422 RepID=UPI0005A6D30E|nr:hypothetical protein [Streptacidiphilus carbonis]